jgi:uncharacterized damage-inducible protein DinB
VIATDPFLAAATEILDETFQNMLETIGGLTTEQLNARLDLEGANSLGVVAAHASHSARFWVAVAVAMDPLPPRDRPAEFRTVVHDQEAFRSELRSLHDDTRALLDREPGLPWDAVRRSHPRPHPSTEEVSGAWALVHAVEHAREHLAQMWLVRQAVEDGRLA